MRSLLEHAQAHPTAWVVIVVASIFAATIDVRTRRIPNALTGPLLIAVCCIVVVGILGGEIRDIFADIEPEIAGAQNPAVAPD